MTDIQWLYIRYFMDINFYIFMRPERYKAYNAVERGLGWLKGWRRVATRYDKYAHRFLGFLYLAGAWIWLKSYLNTT